MKWLRKYFSIVFVVATLLSVLHHHDDIEVHNDCQICVVQSNIVNGDIPETVEYFTDLQLKSEAILAFFEDLYSRQNFIKLQARAPPRIS